MTTLPSRNHSVIYKHIKRQNEYKTSSTIDVRYFEPNNDCIASTLNIGLYKLFWSNSDYLGYTAENARPLDETLLRSSGMSDDLILLEVLHQIMKHPLLWQSKADRKAQKGKASTLPPRFQKFATSRQIAR